MNLSKVQTEPFIGLIEFHDVFNKSVKLTTASLDKINRISQGCFGTRRITKIIDKTGNPWGKGKRIPDIPNLVSQVEVDYSGMALVQVMAYFESYLVNILSSAIQFSPSFRTAHYKHSHTENLNPELFFNCCKEKADQKAWQKKAKHFINTIEKQLNISDNDFSKLKPLFQYFRTVRNCFGHANGYANQEYVNYSTTSNFNNAVIYWNSLTKKHAPLLPITSLGEKIELHVTNSIHASALCYKLGKIINDALVVKLGEEGLLRMSIYYSTQCSYHKFQSNNHKYAENSVSNFLGRSNIIQKNEQTRIDMINYGLWEDCKNYFRIKYPQ